VNVDVNLAAIRDQHYCDVVRTERMQLAADGDADAERARELLR